jgi:hypothetical protein
MFCHFLEVTEMRFTPVRPAATTRSSRRVPRPSARFLPRLEALETRELLAGSISGTVFSDLNRNLVQDPGEPGLVGAGVYLDLNQDGMRDRTASTVGSTAAQFLAGDHSVNQATLSFNLPQGALVTNVAVQLKVTINDQSQIGPPPTFGYDFVTLSHQSNGTDTSLELARGMSGNLDLTFDDSAPHLQSLQPPQQPDYALPADGSNTWTGTYNTRSAASGPGLLAFNGNEAGGVWTLNIQLGADATLDNWSLTVAYQEPERTTDTNGAYSFSNLAAGTYTVLPDLTPPAGRPSWQQLNSAATQSVAVADGQNATANLAVRVPVLAGQVTLNGKPAGAGIPVYLDLNGDGQYQAGEPQATTGGNGYYAFQDFTAAHLNTSYHVRIDTAAVWGPLASATFPAVSLSNDNPAANIPVAVPIVSGSMTTGGRPALAGFPVYIDLNGDGKFEPGEPLTATGLDGNYAFTAAQLKTGRPGTFTVLTDPGWNWRQSGASPQVTLPAGGTGLNFTLVNNAPPTQTADNYTSTTFDITPAQQYMMERTNLVRRDPHGVLLGSDYIDSDIFQQRIATYPQQNVLADWTAAVNGYPDTLQPLAWDPNLMTAANEQSEQSRDLAFRRLTLIPQYVPSVDMAGNPVSFEGFQNELQSQNGDLTAFFIKYFGGTPTTIAQPGNDADAGLYTQVASFSVPGLPGLAAFHGYGTSEQAAVNNYYGRYSAYVHALSDPTGIAHWIPQSRYGDAFTYREANTGATGKGEDGGVGSLVDSDRGYIIDPASALVPLGSADPAYANLIGTFHGFPYIDPLTRTMGLGSEPATQFFLTGPNGVPRSQGFYDPKGGVVYNFGVYGNHPDDRAFVVGVVYTQGFANSVPANPQFSYLDSHSTPVAGASVQLTASYFDDNTFSWVPFDVQSTTTWSGGGYQFQVQPAPLDQPFIRCDVVLNGDPSTLQTSYIFTDPNTGSPLNAKVDFPSAVVFTPPPPPNPYEALPQSITFASLADRTYGDAPFTLSASASSFLPVGFHVLSGPAQLSGNTLTITGAGTVVVEATQAGDSTYAPADPVDQSFTVNPASLTLVVQNQTKVYGAALPGLSGTLTGLVNGDVITPVYRTTATVSSNVIAGGYRITARLNDPNGRLANYVVTNVPGTLTVTKAHLTVTANDLTLSLHQPIPALTATLSGFVLGQTLATSGVSGAAALSTTATAASAVGTYPINVALGSLAAQNYDFTPFKAGTLSITYVIGDPHNVGNANSTIPIKITLLDYYGVNVSSAAIGVHARWVTTEADPSTQLPLGSAGNSQANNDFRYTGGTYLFNLKNNGRPAGKYRLYFSVDRDPLMHYVAFELR